LVGGTQALLVAVRVDNHVAMAAALDGEVSSPFAASVLLFGMDYENSCEVMCNGDKH